MFAYKIYKKRIASQETKNVTIQMYVKKVVIGQF